jgi:hypothetical protein
MIMILRRAIPVSLLIVLLLVLQPAISYPDSIDPRSETGFSDKTPGLATSGFWNGTHGTGALLGTITSVPHGEALPGGAPASFSLDGRYGGTNYMTPIEDQGNCGSCWAFAAVGAMEIQYKVQTGSTVDLSEQNVLSCAGCDPSEWSGKDCTGQGGCGGNYLSDSLNYLKNSGTPDVACDAYTATATPCGTGRCSDYLSRISKVTDWAYISTAATIIKNNLYAGYPVMVWMNVYSHSPAQTNDFPWTDAAFWQYHYYSHAYSTDVGLWGGGHFVVIVGYSGTDYWIVRNSWGTGGGDVNSGYGGYFYMTQDPATGFFGDPSGGEAAVISSVRAPVKTIRISTNTYDSLFPSVAATDSYVYVAWQDDTPVAGSGTNPEIWMRVSNNNGASFGSAIRISTNTGISENPSVAASGNHVYVAWDDDTPVTGNGGNPEIWMRVSANNGASFGSPIRISTNTYDSLYPSVAASGTYVYVAWQDDTPVTGSGSNPEIWMRASPNYGASFGSAIRITTNYGSSEDPSVAASGSYAYVAWEDDTSVTGSGGDSEIWMRVSGNNGASFGSAIRITTNTGKSVYPSVAASGSYVYVAWHDWTPVTGSDTWPEIWLRASSNNGVSFGSAVRITTNTGASGSPSVTALGNYAYVSWMDWTPVPGSGSTYEIWMRVSGNNGVSFGSAIRISTNTGFSGYSSVAASGSYVYVAWDDNTPVSGSGSAYEIWMRVSS